MKKLSLDDRSWFEETYGGLSLPSFYHYFPLTLAISETTTTLYRGDSGVYVDERKLYLLPKNLSCVNKVEKIEISTLELDGFKTSVYDVNYFYDLKETVEIKNFRDNVKKFVRDNKAEFKEADKEDVFEVIKVWYEKHKNSNNSQMEDFGYTLYFAENYSLFDDLKVRITTVDERKASVSIWGGLNETVAVHLISKDLGIPYLQDYTRMETYNEMLKEGYRIVNDGSDVSLSGLRIYKTKLRPRYIIPIFSLERE